MTLEPNMTTEPPASFPRISHRPAAHLSLRRALGRLSFLSLVSMVAIASGCPSPDPEGKRDRFLDDTREQRDEFQGMRLDVGGALADIGGQHLLALSSVIAPDLPLQFSATAVYMDNGDGTGATIDLDIQPLALDPTSTTDPRTPIGPSLPFPGVVVDGAGGFRVDLGAVMVTGDANPITGSDIQANLTLVAAIQGPDLWCGTVEGMVTSPLSADLAGSTFAAVRLDATEPATLPGAPGNPPLIVSCPGDAGGDTDGGMATTTGG